MKLKYKNYILEEDRNCIRLSENKISKKTGDEYEDVCYPKDMKHALNKLFEIEKRNKQDTVELQEYIKMISIISHELKEFISFNVK